MKRNAAYIHPKNLWILLISSFFASSCITGNQTADLPEVKVLQEISEDNYITEYRGFDVNGNTSLAFDFDEIFKWSGTSPFKTSGWGYFDSENNEIPYIKRDRDLGQTFKISGKEVLTLRSITVRLGFGNNVIRPEMYGQKLSVQIFEVSGNPVLNQNGSDSSMHAYHGYPHNRKETGIPHFRDDYFSGEKYNTIKIIRDFSFPQKSDFGFADSTAEVSPDDKKIKGKLLKFMIPEKSGIILEPEKQYAFLILIDKPGKGHGFTLANHFIGNYPDGHAIRRDGNGVFPPHNADPMKACKSEENKAAYAAAHFPVDFEQRAAIQPGTNGYPDVDTWRDLFFLIGGEKLKK